MSCLDVSLKKEGHPGTFNTYHAYASSANLPCLCLADGRIVAVAYLLRCHCAQPETGHLWFLRRLLPHEARTSPAGR
jgi:hypothetical protein